MAAAGAAAAAAKAKSGEDEQTGEATTPPLPDIDSSEAGQPTPGVSDVARGETVQPPPQGEQTFEGQIPTAYDESVSPDPTEDVGRTGEEQRPV